MDIIFHIEYYVYAGEQVAINIVDAADGVTLHRHLMNPSSSRPAATPADLGEGLLPMDRHAPRHL